MMLEEIHKHMIMKGLPSMSFSEQWAEELYRQTTRSAWWHRLLYFVIGDNATLLSSDQLMKGRKTIGQYDAGLQQIPLDQICGSESAGRCKEFDNRFRPRSPRLMPRWLNVAQAWYTGVELPPVVLIQVGSCYFVRDGHHRVSVANAVGQDLIWAHVIVRQLQKTDVCRSPQNLEVPAMT